MLSIARPGVEASGGKHQAARDPRPEEAPHDDGNRLLRAVMRPLHGRRVLLRHEAAQFQRLRRQAELARSVGAVHREGERRNLRLERPVVGERDGEGRARVVPGLRARYLRRSSQRERGDGKRFGKRVRVERRMLDGDHERERIAERDAGLVHLRIDVDGLRLRGREHAQEARRECHG